MLTLCMIVHIASYLNHTYCSSLNYWKIKQFSVIPDGIISSAINLIVAILVPVSYIRGVVECLFLFVCCNCEPLNKLSLLIDTRYDQPVVKYSFFSIS